MEGKQSPLPVIMSLVGFSWPRRKESASFVSRDFPQRRSTDSVALRPPAEAATPASHSEASRKEFRRRSVCFQRKEGDPYLPSRSDPRQGNQRRPQDGRSTPRHSPQKGRQGERHSQEYPRALRRVSVGSNSMTSWRPDRRASAMTAADLERETERISSSSSVRARR